MQVQAITGGPAVGITLVQGVTTKLPATKVWCIAAPDALAAAGVSAGSLVLVGVTNQVSASAPGTPGRTVTGTSTFAPVPSPDLSAPGTNLLSLWQRHAAMHGVDIGLLTQPSQGTSDTVLGEYLVPAQVWPSSKLPRGLVAVSQSLSDRLAAPGPGTVLAMMPWPAQTPVPSGLIRTLAALPAGRPQACSQVVMRLCYDVLRCRPATVAEPGHSAGLSPQASSGARGPSRGTPTAGRATGSETPKSRVPGSPASSETHTPAGTSTNTAARLGEIGASSASARLGDWALNLLQPTAGADGSGRGAGGVGRQGSGGAAAAAGGAGGLTEGQRALLGMAAKGRMEGQVLLQGNLVGVPLLGYTLVWQAEALLGPWDARDSKAAGLLPAGTVSMAATSMTLLLPGEAVELPSITSTTASSPPQAPTPDPHTRGGPGPVSGIGPGPGGVARPPVRPLHELVSLAREAAEAGAGEGGAAEAAAEAAERAVRTGWSASGLTYASLGGVSHLAGPLQELVSLPLTRPELFRALRVRPPRGVLLHGPPGGGKTVLARAAAGDSGAALLVVNGPDIMSEWMGESEARLHGVFAAARRLAPTIIFIDEIDAVAPARGGGAGDGGPASVLGGAGGGSDAAARLVTALLTAMDGPTGAGPGDGVVVIGTTNRPDALDPALRRPGRLERELEVGPPPPDARRQILAMRLRGMSHTLTDEDLTRLADAAHGFVAADVTALVNEAAMVALRRAVVARGHAIGSHTLHGAAVTSSNQPGTATGSNTGRDSKGINDSSSRTAEGQAESEGVANDARTIGPAGCGDDRAGSRGGLVAIAGAGLCVTRDDFVSAQARVKPSALRELAVEIPRVSWSDVGGLADVKQRLKEAVVWPFRAPSTLARLGAVAPRGVLLYGPPGCSKTLLARAVAAEAKLNFLSIKGGELFSKFVGESEKAVAALFARARASAPTIIFFDEIDSLAAARSDNNTGLADRVMAQLLAEMDGLQQRVGVVVLAATNRPDCVDPALLRPGRFDRLVFVPPPDVQSRVEILQVKLRNTPVAPDVQLVQLAEACVGYSGADLGALVREAALAALEEDMTAKEVSMRHFQAAQQLVLPSATPTPHMERVYRQFGGMQACGQALATGPVFGAHTPAS